MAARLAIVIVTLIFSLGHVLDKPPTNVSRLTLRNGLRVVVVRDPLAPVVTVRQNYLAGAGESPEGFPGMAHAQEHMTSRGCAGLSGDQISSIYAQLGGDNNAETHQTVTQYYATVPAGDLEVTLRVDAACMQDVDDADEQWNQERGAIEQEVARDLSSPAYQFITRVNEDMFAGTPYAHDALGAKSSFEATTGAMLKKFYKDWYAPNNAILVIAGDVEPAATLAKVREIYGGIPRRSIPRRRDVKLPRVKAESFTLPGNLPFDVVFVAYRMPGTNSPDYAATRVLTDLLSNERANLYGLIADGGALAAEFQLEETLPKASVAIAAATIVSGADPSIILAKMKSILAYYASNGLPADLVEGAKRTEIASAEFQRNSIPGLAESWSQALAADGLDSPDDYLEAVRRVTPANVNRVARTYLDDTQAIVAIAKPVASGDPVQSTGFGGPEQPTRAPSTSVILPGWAEAALRSLPALQPNTRPADMLLPNGIRLIVQTETISPTVTLVGNVRQERKLESPPGKYGVAEILDGLFVYGTKSRDRITLKKALDDIGASETAGAGFSLRVLTKYFEKGLELLADHVMNPAFAPGEFQIVAEQARQLAAGALVSPEHRAERMLNAALLPRGDPALHESSPESIATVTIDDVKNYYARTFRPDLTTIVIVGDVTPQEAKAQIERSFGGWEATGARPSLVLPSVPLNPASAVHVPDSAEVQGIVNLAEQLGLNRFHPDYYALELGNHVLDGGYYATRFYRDLRQRTGYVYQVDGALASTQSRTVYSISYASDPSNISASMAIIRRNLIAMQTENVTVAELQQAKALLLRQIQLERASSEALAAGLLDRAEMGLPLDEPIVAGQRYIAITADEVRAAFAKWIRPDGFVQVVRGPSPR
jgi:zinc protease